MKTMLIVDDDVDFCRELAAELKLMRVNCHIASNGMEAVRKYQDNLYHIIFLNVDMPHSDGFKAMSAIRTIEKHRGASQIPIVGMSSNGFEEDCLNSGMNDFLHKPLVQEQLKKTVNKWIRTVRYD